MKSKLFIITLSIFAIACHNSHRVSKERQITLKPGIYISPKFRKEDWIPLVMNGYSSHVMGCELKLNKDFTFRLQTCGAIKTGQWKLLADSLYLYTENIRWRNDSLQQYGFKGKWLQIPSKPEVLAVTTDNILTEDLVRKNGSKTLNMFVFKN